MTATIRIDAAGPLTTIQDRGRFGWQRFGVTEAGPMDPDAFRIGQDLLGADASGNAIELALGGIEVTVMAAVRPLAVAVTGGDFRITINGERRHAWTVAVLEAGFRLSIKPGPSGSWAYLAFAAKFDVPPWLGSTATHLASGQSGRALRAGDHLALVDQRPPPVTVGDLETPAFALATGAVRAVRGPQDGFFSAETIATLFATSFKVSADYDRMGLRLEGASLPIAAELSMPSEAIVRGSIQVAGHGDPTILLADHGTTGGYPKIATVISADFGRVAQLRVGDAVRLAEVSATEAVRLARRRADEIAAFIAAAKAPAISLTDRLLSENLVSGVVGRDVD